MEYDLYRGAAHFDGTVVVADIHVGLEDALYREGWSFPLEEENHLAAKLEDVADHFDPERFVLNGDTLHEFGRIPRGLGEKLEGLLELLEIYADDVVLVEGTHDRMLESVTDREVLKSCRAGGTLIFHGDEEPGEEGQTSLSDAGPPELSVVGHEHPAIEIEGEKRQCYLRATLDDAEMLVLPSFNEMNSGTAVNKMRPHDFMSPLLRRATSIRPLVETDEHEVLEFPPLDQMRHML